MNHPFNKNKQLLLIYISVWVVISIIQTLILYYQYNLTFWQSTSDSFFFNISFAVFGYSLWYLVKFLKSSKPGLLTLFINHLSAAGVLILIWISLFKFILEIIFADYPDYVLFLDSSTVWRIPFGVLMYIILVLIYFTEEYYSDLQEKTINEAFLKSSAKEAELKMLKAQINPHFLFNSLNSISSLALSDAQKAHEMIIRLSDYFRYAISKSDNQLSSLKTELENCKRYLEIEQIRFGSKLKINFEIDEKAMQCTLPAMLLQPLYENAVKYGVYESIEEIEIQTYVSANSDYIEIRIENDFEETSKKNKGEGVGLKNIRERLRLTYNSDDFLSIKQIPGKFIASLRIPCKLNERDTQKT